MAHDLEIVNGEASFAYNGKRGNPWHLLGTDVEGDMPLHVMLEASHADYTVALEPVYVLGGMSDTGQPYYTEVEGQYATVRTGGAQPEAKALGIVKTRYEVQQNRELAEIAQEIVGLSNGDAAWDTMGVIRDGAVFFAYLRLPSVKVDPNGINDRINQGLVVSTSHDGSLANTIGYSSVRVVCQNTLSMALSGLTQKISVKHTRNAEERIKAAAAGLSMYVDCRKALAVQAEQMLAIPGEKALKFVLDQVWPIKDDMGDAAVTKRTNVRGSIRNLYANGDNNALLVGDNGWAAYNAVVEYLDWEGTVRKTTNRAERIATSPTLDDQKRDIARMVLQSA